MLSSFRAVGLQAPRLLTLAMTNDCNLACSHCWVEACPRTSPTLVSTSAIRRLLEEFAGMGGEGVRLTGGEPLLHPDWLEVLEFAALLGFERVELQTNALLLDESAATLLQQFAGERLTLQVSIDGASAAAHERVRGAGTFATLMERLQLLQRLDLTRQVSLFFTEMAHNLAEFPQLLVLADELGVGSVDAGTLIAGGRAVETDIRPPAPDDYVALLTSFRGSPRYRSLYAKLGTMAALEWLKPDRPVGRSCCSLAEHPYLTPEGDLFPCPLCHIDRFAIHGVYERPLQVSLQQALERWPLLHRLADQRAEQIPRCQSCPERQFCAAGCIGRAWGSCADLLAPDDRCETRLRLGGEPPISFR